MINGKPLDLGQFIFHVQIVTYPLNQSMMFSFSNLLDIPRYVVVTDSLLISPLTPKLLKQGFDALGCEIPLGNFYN